VERLVHVLACLADGWGIGAPARVLAIAPNPVRAWLGEAAEPRPACTASCLCDGPVKQVQRAAVSAVRSAVKNGESTQAHASERWARSPPWVGGGDRPGHPTLPDDCRG
jgi:hypothetical protein